MNSDFSDRIRSLDVSLFDSLPTQTTEDDRKSLLFLHDCVRSGGDFAYLEIGSHLGGTIQPYYIDPRCRLIYSVDKRPARQADERGYSYEYSDNSTARMVRNLREAFPAVENRKLKTFDCDASDVDPREIDDKPALCFIDGEHTNRAVVSDFLFCLRVAHPNAMIAFHDAWCVQYGIRRIHRYLSHRSIRFRGLMMRGNIYVILLNDAGTFADRIGSRSQDAARYFRDARIELFRLRLWQNSPLLARGLSRVKKALKNLGLQLTPR